MRHALLTAVALAFAAAPAQAGVKFAAYEGPDAIQTGQGGAKVTERGIDFWTQGAPPRMFQVLGFLTDSRNDKLFSGNAVGSSGLAKRVQKLGGNALIVTNQDSRYAGQTGMISPNGLGGLNLTGRAVNRITTIFVVVRYLPE